MRKMVLFLIGVVLAHVLVAGEIVIPVDFSSQDFSHQKMGEYDLLYYSGGGMASEPGSPALPQISKTLVLPHTSVVTSIDIIASEPVFLGKYNVFPAQNPVPVSFNPVFTQQDEDIYSRDEFIPSNPLVFFRTGNKSGFSLANFGISPFKYNPVTGELLIFEKAQITIHYEEGLQEAVYLTRNQLEVYQQDIISMVENPEDVENFSPFEKRAAFSQYEYVVVCPSNLASSFEPLVRWKITRGVGAKVVTTSWIQSNYPAYDLQESIREFVKDCHQNRGMIYLVLAGDYDNLGARLVRVTCSGYSADLPSDLYFSDVVPYSSNWDANNNHIFGQYLVDSCDFYSDVYVGRLPLNSVAEVQNWVSKVLTYEQNPPSGFIAKSLFAGAGLWFSTSPAYSYFGNFSCDSIADNELPSSWSKRKMYQNDTLSYPSGFSDSLSKGFHWSYIAAHGSPNSISWYYYQNWPNIIDNSSMQNLTNGDSLFVISSMACQPGWFDGQECVGEYIFNSAAGGAIAVMFNARYGWGYPPYLGPSEYMCIRVAEKVFGNNLRNIGRAHSLSRDELINWVWGFNDCEHWCINEFNLFGDPETQIYSKQPTVMTVSHSDTIYNLSGLLDVIVSSGGQPIDGAVCCLSRPYDTLFWFRGKTGPNGLAAVQYDTISMQPFLLTVYAKDQLYYQDTIYIDTALTSAVLTYFTEDNDSTGSIGPNSPNMFFGMAHRYTPSLLNNYIGWKIKRVYFYTTGGTNALNDAQVNIYQGASPIIPGPMISSKNFTVTGDSGWKYVEWVDSEAVSITPGEMWLEVGFTPQFGQTPFYGSFVAQCIPTQTDNYRQGQNWSYMSGYGINICWAIKAVLKSQSGVEVELSPELPEKLSFRAEKCIFNGNNSFLLTLPAVSDVTVEVFDISGRLIRRVFDGKLEQGKHRFEVGGEALSTGVYFCRVVTIYGVQILKMDKIR
ncbi:hypothetical protein JXA84_09440 [candidate division WOR-3 bacterium]|nr:hypothetical protein [candidate division WOR-3 bacterium]